jgi:IS5 family transposase
VQKVWVGQVPVSVSDPLPNLCIFQGVHVRLLFISYLSALYCAAKDEKFYGFRGHLSVSLNGVITGVTVTPANVDEREALWEITPQIQGLLIGDKGYISQSLREELAQANLDLQTPLRSKMQETRPKAVVRQLQTVRRLIETVNAQLSERFQFERIRARNLWHSTSRVSRKVLAHTLCCWLNRQLSRPLLQFDDLVAD